MPSTYTTEGWPFPAAFRKEAEGQATVSRESNIAQSIHILLHTEPGERFLVPDYGCDMRRIMFGIIGGDEVSEAYIKDTIQNALNLHERRVRLEEVRMRAFEERGVVVLDLVFLILETGTYLTLPETFSTL